jgi:hypothetical protein
MGLGQAPTDPNKKSGWLNKMVAMLAAIYNQDSKRIEHLSRVYLGCMYKLKRSIGNITLIVCIT